MKKLIVAALVAVVAIFAGPIAHAAMNTTQNVAVLVGVSEVFGFDIWDTERSQSDTVAPGESAIGDIHITASSNHVVPWIINASSVGVVGDNHGVTLPIKVSTLTGAGTKVTDLVLTGSAQAIYTAGASEYPKQGVEIGAMYVVPTTVDTARDLYKGNIVLTMTE